VRTVAVSPTLDNVLVLELIVVIRTFLSFSLETEIEDAVLRADPRERRSPCPAWGTRRTPAYGAARPGYAAGSPAGQVWTGSPVSAYRR